MLNFGPNLIRTKFVPNSLSLYFRFCKQVITPCLCLLATNTITEKLHRHQVKLLGIDVSSLGKAILRTPLYILCLLDAPHIFACELLDSRILIGPPYCHDTTFQRNLCSVWKMKCLGKVSRLTLFHWFMCAPYLDEKTPRPFRPRLTYPWNPKLVTICEGKIL